ncbi:MAG: FTR1 family protein [Planctomycetes bacterium]|nr:FTR1 family protein [Planctomycetota bacterium]MBI3847899.1 FTR1 family protein [Planctomycetota bacterium]
MQRDPESTTSPELRCPTACAPGECQRGAAVRTFVIVSAALVVVGVLVWQGVTSGGNPDPNAEHISRGAAVMNTGILVFREGLEAVLVLAALTASLVRGRQGYWKPVALGAGLSFVASVATWFIVVAIIDSINASALHVQAATGLLAIVVLLVIMNWFFHKIYWSGWICMHERRKRAIFEATSRGATVFWGLFFLGLTAVYREGFEVVLFLQSVRLRAGERLVFAGTAIGLGLTAIVAVLTFVAQRRLPYRKMLVATGVMLGCVLLIMVGESAQELQQAGWITTTPVHVPMPAWLGTWLAIFPNLEGLAAQLTAGILVVGSYFLAKRWRGARVEPHPAMPLPAALASSVNSPHGVTGA